MRMSVNVLLAACLVAFTGAAQAGFFDNIKKDLKKLEQEVTAATQEAPAGAPAPRGFMGLPGMPAGLPTQAGAAPGRDRGMFEITAELDRETRRGPVGRLKLGFDQMASIFGGYPARLAYDDPRVVYVGQIVRTLAGASRMPYAYQGWTPLVVHGKGDASAAAGGLILVESALFSGVESEDELAAVLAHEIAHVEMDHSGYDFKAKESAKAFDEMSSKKDAPGGGAMSQAQLIHAVETMRGYSVEAESEADARAIEILRDAGYNPHALLRVIERFTGEPAGEIKGIRYAYIKTLKHQGASSSGGGNKYPKGRATLLKDSLRTQGMADSGYLAARTDRFNRIMGR
jgi:beta-barrel assembly-enhancing protease